MEKRDKNGQGLVVMKVRQIEVSDAYAGLMGLSWLTACINFRAGTTASDCAGYLAIEA